jgi:gliding motility-associated-like protein
LKKNVAYFFIYVSIFLSTSLIGQVSAPILKCVSVSSPTSVVLSWTLPADPLNNFTQYQIWSSSTQTGIFTMIGTVNTYSQTFFSHAPSNTSSQSQYYYIKTVSNGVNASTPSDTIRSIYLNLVNSGNGVANLNWNALSNPLMPTSSLTYTLSREYPVGVWSNIYIGSKLSFKDTITRCNVFYNYRVQISDGYGCISQSNIKGGSFQNLQPPSVITLDSISVNSNGQVVLGWQPSSSLDVSKYVIYSSSGGFIVGLDTINGYNNTTYTYTNSLASSTSEGYCVAAIDSCGNPGLTSFTHNSIFLDAPQYDLCSRTSTLSWNNYLITFGIGVVKSTYSNFEIYCSINGGTFSSIGTTSNTTFSHSGLRPGDTYCYLVRVRNPNLSISSSSNRQCFVASGLPGPSYAYINSVSVNTGTKHVEITYTIDNTNPYKGCNIYKSKDGSNFSKLAFVPFSTTTPQLFTDTDVETTEKNYYYKIQASDDCYNPGVESDTSKTILLKVTNQKETIFENTLTWNNYSYWSGGVQSYNIYRAVNGLFDPNPIANVPLSVNVYVDNVEDYTSDKGLFSYYVEAVEGPGNIYGFQAFAKSNTADAYVEGNVFIPNAFAPNGLNNIWLPITQFVEKTDYKVKVFNRWGAKVFETENDKEGWNGAGAIDNVYVYLIEYKNSRGEYIQLKGHLTIVR